MPNWCKGSMKLRGKPENILRFVKEGLDLYVGDNSDLVDKSVWLDIQQYGSGNIEVFFINKNIPPYELIHINGTSRAFIRSDECSGIFMDLSENPETIIVVLAIKQAWGYRPAEFRDIAKKYEIDIRLYGIEQGMGFVEDYEILDNGDTFNDLGPVYDSYDDFRWNCPFPWIGG